MVTSSDQVHPLFSLQCIQIITAAGTLYPGTWPLLIIGFIVSEVQKVLQIANLLWCATHVKEQFLSTSLELSSIHMGMQLVHCLSIL